MALTLESLHDAQNGAKKSRTQTLIVRGFIAALETQLSGRLVYHVGDHKPSTYAVAPFSNDTVALIRSFAMLRPLRPEILNVLRRRPRRYIAGVALRPASKNV